MRIFVLLFFLHQPPDKPQLFKYYYSSEEKCLAMSLRLLSAWEHIDEDADVSAKCIDIKELDLV